ncbi:MAG TPA: DMT family transporter [Solirubrobacteraceae bacterium]|nr:DMT family transporter [Solirubrobacteraceae bacterium]
MPARQLTVAVVALVLCAGVLHATWNAIASAISDTTVAFALIGAAQAIIAVVVLPIVGLPRSGAVAFAAASAVIHVAYTAALLQSYRLGEFGRTYPLARGTAPVLVGAGAWVIAGEHLTALQIAGTCTIAAALTAIVFAGGRLTRADAPATAAALLTGVTIAAYTVIDGLGVRHGHNPAGYLTLLFILQAPAILAIAGYRLHRRFERRMLRDVPAGLAAGAISVLAYGIVVWAQTRGPLALVSALRETSVISAALIATLLFKEPFARRRLLPSVAVAIGIVLIAV